MAGHRTPAQNSQREGRNLPRQGRDHLVQLGMGISLGFFTETTGSLPNPGVRRSPSYVERTSKEIDLTGKLLTTLSNCRSFQLLEIFELYIDKIF